MSSQSADQPAPDQAPAPVGMRELPPQPAKPVMPAYTMPAPALQSAGPLPGPAAVMPATREESLRSDDSVIARDDHFEGTFTSSGTISVMGSVKGRIEALRVRIEEGATVDADVIVDEAIVAGTFTGNLTCRERLEARSSGRINGRVETYRLMLHEGARVEGEMHMLTEAPRDASMTIRGSAPVRGEMTLDLGAAPVPAVPVGSSKPAPSVTPASAAKPATTRPAPHRVAPEAEIMPGGSATPGAGVTASATPGPMAGAAPGSEPAFTARRSPVAEALRLETLLVSPRTMTTTQRYSDPGVSPRPTSTSRPRGGTTTGF